MSLHGSLDTFALPDVLTLLSSTGKSGELHVTGGRTEGRVWVDDGKVVAAKAGRAAVPVDALFELLRLDEGSFAFHAERVAPDAGDPLELSPLLAEAQSRLVEWRGIEAVVPSLTSAVSLAPEAPGSQVTVRAEQWRALVAVAAEPQVQGVVDRLGVGEFEACRTLKELVEAGLVAVGAASPAEPAAVPAGVQAGDDDLVSMPTRRNRATASNEDEAPARRRPTKLSEAKAAAAAKAEAGELTEAAEVSGSARAERELEPEEAQALVRQLASLTGDEEAAARTVEAYEKGELGDGGDDEPINRGLLLKFLSSVRS